MAPKAAFLNPDKANQWQESVHSSSFLPFLLLFLSKIRRRLFIELFWYQIRADTGWVWSADWSANPGPSVTTPERCCLSQLIHFWVYIDKPEPSISQFSPTKVQPCSFFFFLSLFLYQNFLAALAGWQSSVWLFLYNFLNSDFLFFLHEGDALFPVLCQLSLILWTVFQCLICCRVRTVPAYPSSDGSRECLCELELYLWHYLEYLCTDLLMKTEENWQKLRCFVTFLALPSSPVMCFSVLAVILGHVLKWFHFELEIHVFLGNWNFQVWQIEMETKKSPLFEWQSRKSPPKALCDSALPAGKSSGRFLGVRICWKCSRGEGGIWCVLEDSSFSSSLKCCWSWGGNICTNFQGLLPQGAAFDGFNLLFLVCDK